MRSRSRTFGGCRFFYGRGHSVLDKVGATLNLLSPSRVMATEGGQRRMAHLLFFDLAFQAKAVLDLVSAAQAVPLDHLAFLAKAVLGRRRIFVLRCLDR